VKGLFVVGTDTSVGKTLVTTSLVRRWVSEGRRIATMKPCETGDGDDAARLMRAVGRPLDPGLVNPLRFALPAAPAIAAAREGMTVDLGMLVAAAHRLSEDCERLVIEGAGGLLVPFTRTQTCAELVQALGLPVLIVARTALGTINHTLLTVEALRARSIPLLGVVFSRSTGEEGAEEAESMALCAELGRFRVLGIVPALTDAKDCASAIDCDALFAATG
jgi:dethiobiotin synthetase